MKIIYIIYVIIHKILSQNTLLNKYNVCSILTKHLPHTVNCKFCNLRRNRKTIINSFFLFHNFTGRRFVFTVDLSNFNIQFLSFLIKSRTFTYRKYFMTSLANCQHHNSLTYGPPVSKIRVT